jgi:hypothetical protein
MDMGRKPRTWWLTEAENRKLREELEKIRTGEKRIETA